MENTLKISIVLYIISVALLIYYKPNIFYVNNNPNSNKLKTFGTGSKKVKTVFPLWFMLLVLAIIIFAIVSLVGNRVHSSK